MAPAFVVDRQRAERMRALGEVKAARKWLKDRAREQMRWFNPDAAARSVAHLKAKKGFDAAPLEKAVKALAELTGEDIWREIADTMWEAVLQGIGDGTRKIHGKVRPVGSQNEAVFQCAFGFYGRKRGDLNDWLVAWPCAFRLSVLAEEL